jgi:NhaP-type Na+/H+ and K+/H+ antiporter
VRRAVVDVVILVATVIGAAVIGFGVPLLWIWIGSILEGDDGVSSVSFAVAMAVLAGIISTYVLAMYLGAWVQAKVTEAPQQQTRSMRDTPYRAGSAQLGPLERVFVVTTLLVSAAFWVWFLFFAGSSLPNA